MFLTDGGDRVIPSRPDVNSMVLDTLLQDVCPSSDLAPY